MMLTDDQRALIQQARDRLLPLRGQGPQLDGMWQNAAPGAGVMSYIYMLDDDHLKFIKHHAAYLGGLWPHCYADQSMPPEKNADIQSYIRLTEGVPERFHISEPDIAGADWPFGYRWNGKLINNDILRYQEAVSNMFKWGALDTEERPHTILEIGAGVGGLALHLQRFMPRANYVLLDIPAILFLGTVYIIVNRPDARIYIYTDDFNREWFEENRSKYDYFALPYWCLDELSDIDLMVNILSFQEMSSKQVSYYAKFAMDNARMLYSANWSRHPQNETMGEETVEGILGKYLKLYPEDNGEVWANFSFKQKHFLAKRAESGAILRDSPPVLQGEAAS